MTHKFANNLNSLVQEDKDNPVLYKVLFNSGYYYYHKGKELHASCERFLYDIFRGTLPREVPLKIAHDYKLVVEYCKKYPQINIVTIEVILNDTPEKVLRKEKKLWTDAKSDHLCLNNPTTPPYTPEWMIRHKFVHRCNECIKMAVIHDIKVRFIFCPMCGKSIKK